MAREKAQKVKNKAKHKIRHIKNKVVDINQTYNPFYKLKEALDTKRK